MYNNKVLWNYLFYYFLICISTADLFPHYIVISWMLNTCRPFYLFPITQIPRSWRRLSFGQAFARDMYNTAHNKVGHFPAPGALLDLQRAHNFMRVTSLWAALSLIHWLTSLLTDLPTLFSQCHFIGIPYSMLHIYRYFWHYIFPSSLFHPDFISEDRNLCCMRKHPVSLIFWVPVGVGGKGL